VKRLRLVPEQCTGCESCVLSCSFEHGGVFSLEHSRIRIERNEERADFRPRVCIQCDERFCVAACPVGALSVDRLLGVIRCDAAVCIGCRKCETACPYGGAQFPAGEDRPIFCDLCGGHPACVDTCRLPRAVSFGEEGGSDERR